MVTRAADRSGHMRACVSPRVAVSSSHDHSSSSGESGRERRRKGKLKMKQQLDAAHLRISALEARVCVLLDIIAQLSSRTQCGHMDATAEFFDLYGDMDPAFATHVATQTDISVDLRYPDVFIRPKDILVHERDLPVGAAESLPTPATAHADAAAGSDAAQTHVPTTHNRLRNFTSVSQDAHIDQSSRQALEVDNAEHRGSGSKEYKPPPGGPLPEPVQTQPVLFDGIAAESNSSSQPLDTMAGADDINSQQDLALTPEQSSRQALEVDNAEHRGSGSKEHKLSLGGPLPEPVHTQPVRFDAIAAESDSSTQPLDTMAVAVDFNSQNLALSGTPSELLPFQSSPHEDRMYADFMGKLHTHQTYEYHTSDEVVMSGIAPSPRFVDGSAPICNAFKEDYNSQDLAEQCGPQPSSPLQMMKDTVISPKHTTDVNVKDVNSQALASQSATSSQAHVPQQPQQSLDLAPTSEHVQDFEHTLDNIIDIFNRRRKISSGVLNSTVTSVRGAAAMRGIDITAYRTYINSRSPRLSASIF